MTLHIFMSIQLFLFTLNGDITFLIETAELRAALKVPQMSVQEFVTGPQLPLSDCLTLLLRAI